MPGFLLLDALRVRWLRFGSAFFPCRQRSEAG